MIRRSTLIAGEILLGLVAALIIAMGVAWWRLSQGPIDLPFLRQQLEAQLSEARSGRPVGVEGAQLAWSAEASGLELRALGVTIEDSADHVLSRFDDARVELNVLSLLVGRIAVTRAEFNGGAISITRKIDGAAEIAFGPPGSPADIIIPPPPPNETLEQQVNRILDGMRDAFAPVGPGGRLKDLSARGMALAIKDDKGGGAWSSDSASFDLSRQGDALALSAEARLEGANGEAPARLRVTTDTAFQSAIVEFGAVNVRPRALLSPAALGPFAGLDAPLTATLTIGLDRKEGVTRLEGDATLGAGTAEMGADTFRLDGGSVRGRYDIDTDELIIDQLRVAGAETRINGEARIRDASSILSAAPDKPAAFDVSLPALTLDLPGVFSAPVSLTDVQVVGDILANERTITLSRLHARSDEALVDGTAKFYWRAARQSGTVHPGVQLDATVNGAVHPQTILHFWPIGLGEGARDYLSKSLKNGRVTDAVVHMDVRPEDIENGPWRNDAVDIRFNFNEAEVLFIDTMSPVTNGRGSAVLRGNRFDLTMDEARLNNMSVSAGRIEIPRLKPSGGVVTIAAHGEGDARSALELLTQPPLAISDRLPVTPASATGRAALDFRFQRPMVEHVEYPQLRFSINGRLDNFAGAMTARRVNLSQGRLSVRGDQNSIVIAGPIRAGSSAVNVQWTELLGQSSGPSSQYQISGDFTADDLERLGYPVAAYAQGRVGVVVSGDGAGFDVDEANVQLDLRDAVVETPHGFWVKTAGVAASASFDVSRGENSDFVLSNLNARGVGMVAQGEVRVSKDGELLSAALSRLALAGRADAQLFAQRGPDDGLDIRVAGDLFDAQPFMDNQDPPEERARARADPPMRVALDVARLKLRGGATLADADVDLNIVRGAIASLVARGRTPTGGAFSLAMGPRPSDPQGRITLASDDAGFAMRAMTGTDNVVGGTATAEGVWRPGPPSTGEFTVHLRDFQVVRLPAMTRLLSSVGSLTGLVETLNGDGIGFVALDAPVTYSDDHLQFGESRAAGPSLGLTGSGAFDLTANNLDIDGVVVPSYGLNSMLGAVPILGDLFVSRQGEGVFAMTYSINGPAETPRVGVNPLSALTPGILRRIFEPIQDTTGARAGARDNRGEARADAAPRPVEAGATAQAP